MATLFFGVFGIIEMRHPGSTIARVVDQQDSIGWNWIICLKKHPRSITEATSFEHLTLHGVFLCDDLVFLRQVS
jgi:hypothetical protein